MPPKPHYSNSPTPHPPTDDSLSAGVHYVGRSVRRSPTVPSETTGVQTSSKFMQPIRARSAAQSTNPDPPPSAARWSWQWLAAGVVVFSSMVGFGSAAVLLKLPTLPNCPRMFLPTASASVRMYCAQLAANKGTREDLLEAVHLIQDLPTDHPLRPEIDRYLEEWVATLLDLADETFHAGELEEAISLAQELSIYVDSALIEERITRWQALWDSAEDIVAEAQDHMKAGAWGKAFQTAGKLTKLENDYWAKERYDELYAELTTARQEGKKLDSAFAKLDRGGLDNLLAAIAAAEKIPTDSPAHAEAQTLIEEAKGKLMDLAVRSLKQGDWQTAMQITNRIPADLQLQAELDDLTLLADATSIASFGTQINLEDAILEAQKVEPGRPLYKQAQALIKHWQSTISAGLNLESAIELAQDGSSQALASAIAQARTVSAGNPRHGEAQRRIKEWQTELERRQDQPILDKAETLAISGNLSQAIAQAQKIGAGRALHGQAQQRIQDWQRQLASGRDRPALQQAYELANQGRYTEAIQQAQQIGSGSPLHTEAQNQIGNWQAELQAQTLMAQAEERAQAGTPEALSGAISLAQQVSSNTRQGNRAQEKLDFWSSRLLQFARERSRSNLNEGIRIAQLIPAASSIYGTAQAQIATWQQLLAGSPATPEPETIPASNE